MRASEESIRTYTKSYGIYYLVNLKRGCIKRVIRFFSRANEIEFHGKKNETFRGMHYCIFYFIEILL